MDEFLSQAAFSRARGVSRKQVTVWKQTGLLVLRGKLVDVEASEKLIDARPEKFRGGVTNRRPIASPRPAKAPSAHKAKHTAAEAPVTIAPVVEAALANMLPRQRRGPRLRRPAARRSP